MRTAATLDLHGRPRPDAEALVRNFVTTWHARGGRAVVRIVTGKGMGSGGVPVLGPAVERLLATELRPLVSRWEPDAGGGAFFVKLR
jgi:DNA-nicking Smr family endonuclease